MTFPLNPALIALLLALTALGYAVATAGMKLASEHLSPLALGLLIVGFALAALAEVFLLRGAELTTIYVAVIAFETILIFALALFLGDAVTLKQVAGAVLVLGGVGLVSAG